MAEWAERQRKPAAGQADYAAGAGLKLRVFASGRRVWYVRGRVRQLDGVGKPRFIVLGEYPGMSREDAEVAAAQARDALRRGLDPVQQRHVELRAAQIASKTFSEVVAEWTAQRSPDWRATTVEARRVLFNSPKLAPWHDRPIVSITAAEVKDYVRGIARNTQQSAVGPVRSIFKHAQDHGYITRSPFVEAGIAVARAEGNASPMIALREGHAPDFSELVAALDAFDELEKTMPLSPWPNILRVLAFTGARPSAIINMHWSDLQLDGDAPTWNLPAARSKIKRDSAIPLSKAAADVLRAVPRGDNDLVWPGKSGKKGRKHPNVEPKLVSTYMAAKGFKTGFKPGRCRDSLASWLDFCSDSTERSMCLLLNHVPPQENTRRKHYAKIGAAHFARVLIERYAAAIQQAREGAASRVVALRA